MKMWLVRKLRVMLKAGPCPYEVVGFTTDKALVEKLEVITMTWLGPPIPFQQGEEVHQFQCEHSVERVVAVEGATLLGESGAELMQPPTVGGFRANEQKD